MSNIKLSIIVPIYGVEQYLRKCVDSLLAQDLPSSVYEIILVDDESPDTCPQICDEYARMSQESRVKSQELPPIRVIHQENGGLSAARNAGIKCANGAYLCFVDSDDYWEPNVLGGLMAQVERDNLDVLRFNYQNVNERYEVFSPNKDPKRDVDYGESVVDGETFLNERLGPGCYAWQFILRRDLIVSTLYTIHHTPKNGDCLFTPGIYFEDTEWTPRMLLRAKRIASTPMVVYNYLWRTGSITLPTDPIKRKKVLEDKIRLIRGFKEQSRLVKDPIWFTWMTSSTVMSVLGMLAKRPSAERKPYLQELKSLNIFPLYTKKEKMLSHKIKTIMANISPSLYCFIMNMLRKG